MTRKQSAIDKASGALGTALASRIVRDFGNVQAFAKRIGYSPWSVWRWVQNDIAPSHEGAECIVALYPELKPLLESKGCYKRKTLPLGRRAETAEQSQARIAEARREAAEHAADHALPWPSESTRAARRPLVALLAAARNERAMEKRKAERKRTHKAMPSYPHRVSHSGDFIERLDAMTASDVAFTPSYAMEER